MGKHRKPRSLLTTRQAVCRMLRVSPQKLNLVAADDPRQEGRQGAGRSDLLAQAHRQDVKKTLSRRLPTPRTTMIWMSTTACRRRGLCRQGDGHEAFPARARGRVGRIREAVFEPDDRRSRSRGGRLMGQKDQPDRLRLGINKTWDSRWYAERPDYGELLHEDFRSVIPAERAEAGCCLQNRHRAPAQEVPCDDPLGASGFVIGKKGADIEKLAQESERDDQFGSASQHR
jgi:hypothetical protein